MSDNYQEQIENEAYSYNDDYEYDPEVLKENIEYNLAEKQSYKKQTNKLVVFEVILLTIGFILNALLNKGNFLPNMEIGMARYLANIPFMLSLAPIITANVTMSKYRKVNKKLINCVNNLNEIKDQQIYLGNEKIIEEMNEMLNPHQSEKTASKSPESISSFNIIKTKIMTRLLYGKQKSSKILNKENQNEK